MERNEERIPIATRLFCLVDDTMRYSQLAWKINLSSRQIYYQSRQHDKLTTINKGYNKGRIFLVMKKHVTYNDNVPVFLSANDGILDRYSQSISVKSVFKPGTSCFLRRNKYKSYSGMVYRASTCPAGKPSH